MKKFLLTAGPVLGALVLFLGGVAGAQEAGETNYTYGTVQSISSSVITVTEYDYDNDTETSITYAINSGTKFENVGSFADIKAGDEVEISFTEEGGKRTAVTIYKETSTEEYIEDIDVPEGQEDLEDLEDPSRG